MNAVALGPGREPGRGLRWTAAALLMAGVHVGAGWWLVGRAFAPPPPSEGAPGVTIELEPMSVPAPPTADPKPRENAGSNREPQTAEAPDGRPEPPPPAEPPPVEPPPVASAPPVEAAVAPPPEPPVPQQKLDPAPPPTPAPEVVPPPAPSDAVLAPPSPPRPVPPKKVAVQKPPKPDPREEAREAQAEARQEIRDEARREARAQAAADARAQRQAARDARAARAVATREGGGEDRASAAPVASGASIASWRGELAAHLRAYKPDVQVAAGGTAVVTITIDRGGRVVAASLTRSSGDGTLDQAAVAMMHRASPVPAPPPETGRQTIPVPVRFY